MSKLAWLAALTMLSTPVAIAASPSSSETAEADKEKRICKKTVETGSLVKGKKVCLTQRQWDQTAERGQTQAREMQTLISTERGN